MKVFLNPGHCIGVDPGAVNRDLVLEEADIAYQVAQLVKDYLEAVDVEVILEQDDSLWKICYDANMSMADLFVSIHLNSSGHGSAKGTETFAYSEWTEADRMAHCVQNQLVDTMGTIDRGVKYANFYVLKNTAMPAILTEIGFIDNNEEAQYIVDNEDAIARAIARGITDYISRT